MTYPEFDPRPSVDRRLAFVVETDYRDLEPDEADELFALAREAAVDGGFAFSLSLEEARAIIGACLPRLER